MYEHDKAAFDAYLANGIDADVAKIKALAPELQKVADLALTLARTVPGISPEVVADAEKAAEVIAEIAGELAAAGM